MNKAFLISLLTLILISCSTLIAPNNKSNQVNKVETKYFEGEIQYKLEYSKLPENVTSELLKQISGATIAFIFKNGNFKKQYYSIDGRLTRTIILDLKEQKLYYSDAQEDTTYWFDITKPDTRATYTRMNDTIINNYQCTQFHAKLISPNLQNKLAKIEANSYYCYAKNLAVNPDWYKNFYEANYNELIQRTKSLALVTFENGIFWNTHTSCDTIIWRKVEDIELSTDIIKSKHLKEQ